MEILIEILIQILPYLIISGVLLYIFHEYLRFLGQRDNQVSQSSPPPASKTGSASGRSDFSIKLQLQAAERFVLYLERIEPGRLVMRTHQNGMSAKMLQNEMLKAIREEFDHNLSQQIYISEGAWNLIKNAKDEMNKFISAAGDGLGDDVSSIEFSRRIFSAASKVERLPSEIALEYMRKETALLLQK